MRLFILPTIMVKNQVFIDLTEAGEKQRDRVQEAVFSYLALLRQRTNGGGIPSYVYEECKTLADIAWRFQVRLVCVYLFCQYTFKRAHTSPRSTKTTNHHQTGEGRAHHPRQLARQSHAGVSPAALSLGPGAPVRREGGRGARDGGGE